MFRKKKKPLVERLINEDKYISNITDRLNDGSVESYEFVINKLERTKILGVVLLIFSLGLLVFICSYLI